MKFYKYTLLFTFITAHAVADNIDLNDLKRGANTDIYVGSTSGLVTDSVNSVNQLADKQYRDSQQYSSSSYDSSSTNSNSSNSTTNSSNSSANRSSSSSPTGLKEIYDGGYKSSQGNIIYRVKCHSGQSASAYKDNNGWWRDSGGSSYGSNYRNLSAQQFGNKYCQ